VQVSGAPSHSNQGVRVVYSLITGTPTAPTGHNVPSFYSFRTTMAGEVSLLKRQLAARVLPDDLGTGIWSRLGAAPI
jgi:hypothetical protein